MKVAFTPILAAAALLAPSLAVAQGNSGNVGGNPNPGGGNPNIVTGASATSAFDNTLDNYNLTWTNRCSTAGSGGEFFSTCASASLFLYSNGWMELRYWNRAGFNGTFANSTTNAIGLSGVGSASGTRGTAVGNGWQALLNGEEIDWSPATGGGGIPGPNTADGFNTSGMPDAFCSDLATSCSGGFTTPWLNITSGGYAQFMWFVGGTFSQLNAQTIALQLHQQSGPNGWSTGYLCYSDGSGINSAVVGGTTWECDEDDPGGPNEVVPEPATMTLLATGLVGLAATRRRKKIAA